MSTTARHSRRTVGCAMAFAGGGLGVLAGIIQTLVGPRIPNWNGAKTDSVGLGLLTVALSLVALGSATVLRTLHPTAAGQSAACLAGLAIPAAVCFSTVGRLWWFPGSFLLLATAVIATASDAPGMVAVVRADWVRILVSVLGAYLLLIAVSTAPALLLLLGVAMARRLPPRHGCRCGPPGDWRCSFSPPCRSPR